MMAGEREWRNKDAEIWVARMALGESDFTEEHKTKERANAGHVNTAEIQKA